LAAICSLFRYAALAHPEHAASIARVLAIGPKRFDRALISYLTETEVDALLAACDQGTWTGRRDRVMLLLAVQTGLRISELIGLCQKDVYLGVGAYVTCHGKGRKDRITPLTSSTSIFLGDWLTECVADPSAPLFPNRRGSKLSRDAVEHRLAHYVGKATGECPSLAGKTVTVHVLRHTTAMRLLHAGIDTSVIALWLGHAHSANTRRPAAEGAGTGQNQAAGHPHRSVSAARQPACLARTTLIMPTISTQNPHPAREPPGTSA
jgi:site-specific recombinase XerD